MARTLGAAVLRERGNLAAPIDLHFGVDYQRGAWELPLELIVSEVLATLQAPVSPDFEGQGSIVNRLGAID